MLSEINQVHAGDKFSFLQDGPVSIGIAPDRMLDSDGNYLVLYQSGDAILGHISDHTPVWIY